MSGWVELSAVCTCMHMYIHRRNVHTHTHTHTQLPLSHSVCMHMYTHRHNAHTHTHTHSYHSPTPYAAIAMSPFEMAFYQIIFLCPLFLFPINGLVFISVLVYIYYFSLIDHSGIKMESMFPWQPNTMFHDDHHK